mgnify:CR=1 FL=1
MAYSMEANHYNDPYGYFVLRTASCAGCARATALCLDILGIPYEHVNENQYSHQWCRVPMEDGSYWICDAFGLYCGPEPEPISTRIFEKADKPFQNYAMPGRLCYLPGIAFFFFLL